ncbi:MAG: hypothetical protein ACLFM0_08045 [Spirochaetales bacterium]
MAKIIQFPGGDFHENGETDGDTFPSNYSRYPNLMLFELGLSEGEVDMLISGDPASRGMLFELAPELSEDDLPAVPILRYAHALLTEIQDAEPVRATAKGNLPAALVKSLHAGAYADAELFADRVAREGDSIMLSWTRHLCQSGGLLSYRAGKFQLTRAGHAAMEASNYSEIYRLMFECHLRKPQLLDRYDRYEDDGAIGESLPFLLFAARDSNYEYLYEEDFAALVYAVSPDSLFQTDKLSRAVALKLFRRFGEPFGLFAPGPAFEPPVNTGRHSYDGFGRWWRTPVFDRVFKWHVDPPPRGVMRPEQAAIRWMDAAHELELGMDRERDQLASRDIESYCLRAIERCPEDPDAYVVWARLHAEEAETALAIIDLGETMSADLEPDTPEDVSPWSDHEFRNVMRLHIMRAEILLELGRYEEAFAEYEWLLEVDPYDSIGAADSYAPALIESGRYTQAEKLLNSVVGEDDPFAMWNLVLTAFALGDKQTAAQRLAQAHEMNPYISERLLNRSLAPMPDEYVPGERSEAIVYEHQAFAAWKSVPAAREWLKRHRPRLR